MKRKGGTGIEGPICQGKENRLNLTFSPVVYVSGVRGDTIVIVVVVPSV